MIRVARQSEERYALAAAGSGDGLWDWNVATGTFYCCDRWKLMLGVRDHAALDRIEDWYTYVHEEDLPALRMALDEHLAGHTLHFQCEYRVRRTDGEPCWLLCRGVAVRDEAGRPIRMAGSQTDVTDQWRLQVALAYAATHDALTGLPNRTMVTDLLEASIRRTRGGAHRFAVLFIDLDGFKDVNDILGHVAGDRLLIGVTRRLKALLRPGDVLARIGGDEFAVVVDTAADPAAALLIAQAVQESLRRPFHIGGREVRVSASIGSADSCGQHLNADDLLRAADTAMYCAKRTGGGRHEEFDAVRRGGIAQDDFPEPFQCIGEGGAVSAIR